MDALLEHVNGKNISIFIAMVVAVFSGYQALLLRKHNRLSVRPHIASWTRHKEAAKKGQQSLYLFVENNGLGPAIIKEMAISFDGQPLGTNAKAGDLMAKIKEIIEETDLNVHFDNGAILTHGSSLREGKEIALLTLDCHLTIGTSIEAFETFIDRFDFSLRYKSIYGENFTLDTSKPPVCY